MRPQIVSACIVMAAYISTAAAQTETQSLPPYRVRDASLDILHDEKTIWKDIFRIHRDEFRWLVPVIVANAAAVSSDYAAVKDLPTSKTLQGVSHTVSSLGAPYPLFG